MIFFVFLVFFAFVPFGPPPHHHSYAFVSKAAAAAAVISFVGGVGGQRPRPHSCQLWLFVLCCVALCAVASLPDPCPFPSNRSSQLANPNWGITEAGVSDLQAAATTPAVVAVVVVALLPLQGIMGTKGHCCGGGQKWSFQNVPGCPSVRPSVCPD